MLDDVRKDDRVEQVRTECFSIIECFGVAHDDSLVPHVAVLSCHG